MSKYSFVLVLSLALVAFSAPVLAHHGASAYDNSTLTTLSGIITDFQFIQPHPSLSETFGETMLALTGRGLHVG